MDRQNIEDIYKLSPIQEGILFHTIYSPNSGVYCEQFHRPWGGFAPDMSMFQQAWQRVVDRHTILRTSFYWDEVEHPLQVVHRQVKVISTYQDWRDIPIDEQNNRLDSYLKNDRCRGFNLSEPPLMRTALIQLANGYEFLWTYHHILLDGWSAYLVLEEFINLYEAFSKGQNPEPEKSLPYREYIAWLGRQDISRAESFWRKKLKDFASPTAIGIDMAPGRLPSQEEDYDQKAIKLPVATTRAIQSFAKQHHLTLNTIIQGVWALILSHYSGEEDVVLGSTVSGRPASLPDSMSMVGLFINTLPVRVTVSADDSLVPWLKKLQEQQAELIEYEYSPLVQVQTWSEVPRGTPLFDSILAVETYPVGPTGEKVGRMRDLQAFQKTNYPLTVVVEPGEALLIRISYDSRRFDSNAILRMLGHMGKLLESIIRDPEKPITALEMLTESEKQQILIEWNDTKKDYPENTCIHQLIEAQAERTPEAVALVFEDTRLSYKELNKRANKLAHYLRKIGVGPDVPVGICMERSIEMVVSILAVLKAGGAYMPLDPDYPKERLAFMLEDARTPVILCQKRLIDVLPEHGAAVIYPDSDCGTISQESKALADLSLRLISQESDVNPINVTTAKNLAYVIYTSGSTGKPKGAMNTHAGLCNRLLWMQDTYSLTLNDHVLQKTPFSFDVSVWEFLWPLLTGACLVVAKPGGHRDNGYLVDIIVKEGITIVHFVPSMLQLFLEEPGVERCACLRQVICSGEAMTTELQQRFFEKLSCSIDNLYGPTEASIDVSFWHCEKKGNLQTVPIGRPIANTRLYILDSHLQPVPVGVSGELHIGGVGLGRGYLNRPELTKERFIPDPFSARPGDRLYKTGDLARYLHDGNIVFIGRIDGQIKIRGLRVELGEIESVLLQHPDVKASVVTYSKKRPGKELVAYLVSKDRHLPDHSDLRRFLKDKLPDYMIPSAFVELDHLPLNSNGKVDRKALPEPGESRPSLASTYVQPRSDLEQRIADIWKEVLHIDTPGIHDNFFELGGHSLLIMQIFGKLRKMFGKDLSMVEMFEYPTISSLAGYLTQREPEEKFQEVYTRAEKQKNAIGRQKQRLRDVALDGRDTEGGED